MGDVMADPKAWEIVKPLVEKGIFGSEKKEEDGDAAAEAISDEMNAAMVKYMPLRGPVSFGGNVSMRDIQKLVDKLNSLE